MFVRMFKNVTLEIRKRLITDRYLSFSRLTMSDKLSRVTKKSKQTNKQTNKMLKICNNCVNVS